MISAWGSAFALALGPRRQQERAMERGHADAEGGHFALQVLMCIVDGPDPPSPNRPDC
jgi:hypothetical protein